MTIAKQNIFHRSVLFLAIFLCACTLVSQVAWAQNKFPAGAYTSGPFTITFGEDGNHSVTMNGEVAVKGTYTIKDNVIELADKEGQFACSGVIGKYKWKAQDKALAFEKVEDECEGRAEALAQPWAKK